jgi:predicted GNAT superfamily acetyltransferase
MFTFRDLYTPEELERVADLEKAVWTLEDRAIVPSQIMMVIIKCGGHVAGAFDGDTLVGFTMALAARKGDAWRLWSHMAGVAHTHRKRGVGFGLKQYQRHWAIQNGYDNIGWTFDPLQRVNANFNLRRLGAVGTKYVVNAYGEMSDELNRGLPSDRLEASWDLSSARVVDHADGDPMPVLVETHERHFALVADEKGNPKRVYDDFTNAWYFVEIPFDIAEVRAQSLERALAWRMALRDVLVQAFALGYHAVDFVNSDTRCWYVLYRQS